MILRLAAALLLLPLAVAAARAEPLTVMTFNVWRGGDQVGIEKTVEAIRAADPDVVLLQEAEGATLRIAALLGWPYASPALTMIARRPLFEAAQPGLPLGYLELRPGRFVALANLHLPSDPYGPYAARDGDTADGVLAIEAETRMPSLAPYLEALPPLAADGLPVVMGGDFNAPSHLDWIEATVGGPGGRPYPLVWPATAALAEAGFVDAYRSVHPDPVGSPGITWPAGYPAPYVEDGEAFDRIDMLHVLNAQVRSARLVGEPGGEDVDIEVAPFPSDHRALVVTLDLEPGPAPAMLSPARRAVAVGEPIALRYHAGTDDGRLVDGRVSLLPQGGAPDAPVVTLATNDGTDRLAVALLGTAGLPAGAYDAVLLDPAGGELARTPVWLLEPGEGPAVVAGASSYAPAAVIVAAWRAAPGNRADWIGIYPAGEPDPWNYLAFLYTDAAIGGAVAFDADTIGAVLEPGDYELRLMLDDGYTTLAVSPRFAVTAP